MQRVLNYQIFFFFIFVKAHYAAHGLIFKKLQDASLSILKAVYKGERDACFILYYFFYIFKVKNPHHSHSTLPTQGDSTGKFHDETHPTDITISPVHAQKLMQFLASWLTEHVHKMDKDMSALFCDLFYLMMLIFTQIFR
jgi:hypothetical protein